MLWSRSLPASNLLQTRLGALPKTSGAMAKASLADGVPDTLEIFVMYVEFKSEDDEDNSSTTGKGTFNSALDTNFTLDPSGFRDYRFYLEKHMEFAQDYFNKISNGRLHIRSQIFPKPESNGAIKTPFQLSKRMASYNPTKKDEEKNVVFFERKANALMSFVAESIRKADGAENAEDNPFTQPLPGANTFRCYMIFHAGHNGLIDGGSLGQLGADTPHDIVDFFVTKDDFSLLSDLPEENLGNPLLPQPEDTLGILVGDGDKRITEIMVLGESASQDEVNFGINGILVNQIARQIGMPDTWDRGTGFTQLGYFDLMDVGHLSIFGFVPVFPSAWIRYFMGWEEPIIAYPADDGRNDYMLYPPQLTSAPRQGAIPSLKIPLNDKEYLLVENRQRALNDSITIEFSYQSNKNNPEFDKDSSVTIPISFIDSLMLDSLCDSKGKNCEVNKKRPKGIITSASSYDMGLPGSGILVWHVNEWYISQAIRYGFVNASSDESKEFVGINLVEADGDLSIGKEGKDQLGQSVFDFGSGSDMLPHIRKSIKDASGSDTTWEIDTLTYISPYGFSNTNSWNDGRSHISLRALVPEDISLQPGINGIFQDSIFNFGDSLLSLRVSWNDNPQIQKAENSFWPLETPVNTQPQGLINFNFKDDITVLSLSDEGIYQAFDIAGKPILPVQDTLLLTKEYDSLLTLLPTGKNTDSLFLPAFSYGSAQEKIKGSAAGFDSLFFVLAESGKLWAYETKSNPIDSSNSEAYTRAELLTNGLLGPMVAQNKIWILSKNNELISFGRDNSEIDNIAVPALKYQNICYVPQSNTEGYMALAANSGELVLVNLSNGTSQKLVDKWASASEYFHVLSSDFDRDGNYDVLVFGSRGSVQLVNLEGESFPNFPLELERFKIFVDSLGNPEVITQDMSAPALGDINMDGYPDIVFTAPNKLAAINHLGNLMWATNLSEKQNVGLYYSSAEYPGTVVQSTPLIFELTKESGPVILIATPDGLIWALDGKGEFLQTSSYNSKSNIALQSGIKSSDRKDWPLAAGSISFDTTASPYVNISLASNSNGSGMVLFSQSGRGVLNSWIFPEAKKSPEAAWLAVGGAAARMGAYSVENLSAPKDQKLSKEIRDFHIYPSPVTGNIANVFLDLGAPAQKARIRVYDLSGLLVLDKVFTGFETQGNHSRPINFSNLGADVYTLLVEVWFKSGGKKQKWSRVGVIK